MRKILGVVFGVLLLGVPGSALAGTPIDFEDQTTGNSVEGLGAVHPALNIQAVGDAVVIETFAGPKAYGAPSPTNEANACLLDGDGNRVYFADWQAGSTAKGFGTPQTGNFFPWEYEFSFIPGMTVSNFSIIVLDVGDYNPGNAENHSVTLEAFDEFGVLIDTASIAYVSDGKTNPVESDPYGNLIYGAGDACDAQFGEPGFFELAVASPTGIASLVLSSTGQDPKVGFDNIVFDRCTRTIGYWKNHCWEGMTVFVGDGEEISQADGSNKDAVDKEDKGILWNATGKDFSMLCAQLIAAKLNCASNDGLCASDELIAAADAMLADNEVACKDPETWEFPSKSVKKDATAIASDLDMFNNEFDCADPCFTCEAPFNPSAVITSTQGLRNDGGAVREGRSIPEAALVYDNSGDETDFFSLGFGGEIVVEFPCPITDGEGYDIRVVEDTWGTGYPLESADISVWDEEAGDWVLIGTADNSNHGTEKQTESFFDLGAFGIRETSWIKVVDTTNPADHIDNADGFDLNYLEALHNGETCW